MNKVKNMKFQLSRVSIIPNSQISIFDIEYEDTSEYRNIIFNKILDKLVQIKKKNITFESRDYFIYVYEDNSIVRLDLISENSSIKFLEYLLNDTLNEQGVRIYVRPQHAKREFWNIVLSNKYIINEVEFELLAPNFLNGKSTALDISKHFKGANNAKRMSMKLINEEGLTLTNDDVILGSMVDYTSHGAGQWSIKAKYYKDRKKITVNSSKTKKTTELKMEVSSEGISEIELLLIKDQFKKEELDE